MLGAATLYGLGAGAEPGARHALKILSGEIDRVLGQLGCNSLAELGPHLLKETLIESEFPAYRDVPPKSMMQIIDFEAR